MRDERGIADCRKWVKRSSGQWSRGGRKEKRPRSAHAENLGNAGNGAAFEKWVEVRTPAGSRKMVTVGPSNSWRRNNLGQSRGHDSRNRPAVLR